MEKNDFGTWSLSGKWILAGALCALLYGSATAQQHCRVRYTHNEAGDRIQRDWYCWTPGDGPDEEKALRALEELRLGVMPNPAWTNVTVVVPEAGVGGTLELMSTTGAVKATVSPVAASNVMEVSRLDAGLYLLRLTKGAETIISPFIVEH